MNKIKLSPYKIEYWISKGFSKEESINKIKYYKLKTATNLEGFIYRYGKEDGIKKYNDYCKSSGHTLEKFILRYGEKGKEKWETYLKTKDSNSFAWALKKSNNNLKLANKIKKGREKSVKNTLEKFIQKYGETEGRQFYLETNLKKTLTFDKFKNKFTNEKLALEKWEEINSKKDSSSFKHYLSKNKNLSLEEVYIKYKKDTSKYDSKSLYFFYKKYKGKESMDKIRLRYIDSLIKRTINFGQASKESLVYLKPLYDYFSNMNYEVFLGIKDSKEYFIYHNKIFFYDFAVPKLGIIIEYNGEYWHPNYEKNNIDELNFKNHLNHDKNSLIEREKEKIKSAIQNKFDVLILWSSDSIKNNKIKVINFLKSKNIINENKEDTKKFITTYLGY